MDNPGIRPGFRRFSVPSPMPAARSLLTLTLLLSSGCTPRAPAFFLMGSYFPSWLVGIALGIPLAALVRLGLIRAGIDDHLPLRLLVYTCLAILFAMGFSFVFSPQ
ncbi:YtcA family lipoprotein [Castellaniella hirudinis]|uniref:YtcA family lipoprotein n=1 Tax=Castellaniella hirudinis TaxID=1144617 RepID=UPI0039C197EB